MCLSTVPSPAYYRLLNILFIWFLSVFILYSEGTFSLNKTALAHTLISDILGTVYSWISKISDCYCCSIFFKQPRISAQAVWGQSKEVLFPAQMCDRQAARGRILWALIFPCRQRCQPHAMSGAVENSNTTLNTQALTFILVASKKLVKT